MAARRTMLASVVLLTGGCSLVTDLHGLDRGDGGSGAQHTGSGATGAVGAGGAGGDGVAGSSSAAGASGTGGSGALGGNGGTGGAALVMRFGEHEASDVTGVTTDTYVDVSTPTFNYGADAYFGADADANRVVLLRFELTALPASTRIVGADLHLWTTSNASNGIFTIYSVIEPWEEGNGSAVDGVCNWNERLVNTPWATAGVGLGSHDSFIAATFAPSAPYAEYSVALPVDLVQGWVTNSAVNNGIAIITASPDAAEFRASEHGDLDHRPRLDVSYLP